MATKNETAIVEIVLKGQQANASLKDMEKSARALSSQLKNLPKDSQEFADKKAEFQKMSKSLKGIQDDVKGVGGVFQSISKEIKGFGILAVGYLGFDWLKSSITGIIKNNAELSDSLADIRKTTGMTEAEARKLNTSFGQINTRTAAKELRNIAIVGGQLGIAKNDIFGFTVAVDKMNVALGDEFTGGAEEVTKAMGGLRNIFTDIKSNKVDEDLLHIGNAINELASSGAATGPVVSDFANRIGGVGITLGLTSGQVLGLSATLQELNVSTERGGTAVTKILQKMTTNTTEFAKVAKMPVKEFTELVNKDLYGAFVKVVEGSKQGGTSATAFGKILNDLGVDGAGASEVFAKLGSNTKMLGEKVDMANTSLKGTDSIMAEFTMKNATLGAEMERLSKGFAGAFTNSAVSDGIKSIVSLFADLFDKTKAVSQGMDDERNTVNALMIEIKSSNATNERRKEIYEELKAINPDIVEGIDKENISIQELTKNVIEYNKAQINKIAVQKQQEKIDEQNQIAGEKAKEMAEKQSKALEALGKVSQLNGIVALSAKKIIDDENLSIAEKIKMVYQLARAQEYSIDKNGSTHRNQEAREIQSLTGAATSLTYAEIEYSKAVKKSNDLVADKNQIMHMLGMDSKVVKNEIDYTKLSIEQLNNYIKDSKESMGQFHKKEAAASLVELKRREVEKKNTIIPIDEETKKRLVDNYAKLLEKLKQLEHEHVLAVMSGNEREIELVHDKYDALRLEAKGHADALKKISVLESEEIMTVMMQQFEKQALLENKEYYENIKRVKDLAKEKQTILKNADDVTPLNKAEKFAQESQALSNEWDKRLADAQAHNEKLLVGEEQMSIDILPLYMKRNLAIEALNQSHEDKLDEETKVRNQKRLSAAMEVYGSLMSLYTTTSQYKSNTENNQLKEDRKNNDEIKANYKKQLDGKLITQKQYDNKISQLDSAQDKRELEVKKQQAEREKKAARIQALVNTAIAVSKANTATPYPPINAILMGIALAMGMAQVQAIESQPVAYAKGGFNKTSDDPQGFTSGATLYSNSSSGKPFIAGEAGKEWIAPNWMLQNPVTANTIEMLEAVRTRGFASGGSTSTKTPKFESTNQTANQQYSGNGLSELTSVVSDLNSTLQQLKSEGIPAYINYDLFQKTMNSFDSAKASAQVKT